MSEHERLIHGESETKEEAIDRYDRADSEPDPDMRDLDSAGGNHDTKEDDGGDD